MAWDFHTRLLVSFREYKAVVADRPRKLNATQVGFEEKSTGKEHCGVCFHFGVMIKQSRNVCEIFRPKDGGTVPAAGWCKFFTSDGKKFPGLEAAA